MDPAMWGERVYEGPETLVVAMDIGTTQSAVSFAHFAPGTRTRCQTVTNWPGLTEHKSAAKIPTIVSYRNGEVKSCGAEALPDFEEHREHVAHWFKVPVYPTISNPSPFYFQSDWRLKLHLHPTLTSSSDSSQSEIPPLPKDITIERVYADMMKYLMDYTQRYFESRTPNGAEIWARVRNTLVIVLPTPNEWYIREQTVLRKAAITASLVREENASQLLQFVTEAEASVHYVLHNKPGQWLQTRTLFAVIDCGGSTVDTTVYRCVSTDPLSLNEARRSECIQAGGVFVDREVRKMFERKLRWSSFGDPEIIQSMVDAFERQVKPKFDGTTDEYSLKFGSINDNDASLGILKGRIPLSNKELTTVFDPVVDKIVTSCSGVITSRKTEYVLIVGGFGESPYLQKVLSQRLVNFEAEILPVGDSVNKAASEGAIIGQIKQLVVARVARATFGGCVRPLYNRKLHRERKKASQIYADGKRRVDGAFHEWIKKGTTLQSTFAHKLPYHVAWEATTTSLSELSLHLKSIGIEVFACESEDTPMWCKDEQGGVLNGMNLICTLNADLSALSRALEISIGPHGKRFYRVDYEVCVYFGGTQLRANLQWKENGVLREGPVTVMPYVS